MSKVLSNKHKSKRHSSAGAIIIIALAVMLIIAGAYSYLPDKNKTAEEIFSSEPMVGIPPTVQQQPVAAIIEKSITAPEAQPDLTVKAEQPIKTPRKLPSLDDSDPMVLASAGEFLSPPEESALLSRQDIIRNFVVFVDNFSRGELVTNFSPLSKPGEPFSIVKVDRKMYLNPESYNRYTPYVELINSINIDFAIRQYRALKPLFDEAYHEIGYPDESFDSRLIEAIEIVLGTPIIYQPIALIAPSAMYKFADPDLEALSGAQKLIIRMGPDNLLKLKAKLQQIKNAL